MIEQHSEAKKSRAKTNTVDYVQSLLGDGGVWDWLRDRKLGAGLDSGIKVTHWE